jgi:hypothetical protein
MWPRHQCHDEEYEDENLNTGAIVLSRLLALKVTTIPSFLDAERNKIGHLLLLLLFPLVAQSGSFVHSERAQCRQSVCDHTPFAASKVFQVFDVTLIAVF